MKNRTPSIVICGVALASLISFTPIGCEKRANEVRVAVAGPFTGNIAAFGEMIKRGAQLRAKEINAAGGINGKTLTLIFEDDTGKDREASLVAERIGVGSFVEASKAIRRIFRFSSQNRYNSAVLLTSIFSHFAQRFLPRRIIVLLRNLRQLILGDSVD